MEETSHNTTPATARKRRLKGTVVSARMQYTVVVRVDRVTIHPVYHKRYTTSKRYSCDSRTGDFAVGDRVIIEETRPISKTKRWRVISKEQQV
ncbi:MAG: 30S ribosomal protein S17 [Patescibacteria group bacterium]